MEGEDVKQLEWIPDLGRIVIRFPYDPMLVTEVKTIPGRRWHRDQKIWSVPLERVGEAARILLPLGFEPTPQVEKILNGEVEGLAGLAQQVEEAANQDESYQDGWSVSRLNEAAREALVQSVPATIWLHGEVLEFDRPGTLATRTETTSEFAVRSEGDDERFAGFVCYMSTDLAGPGSHEIDTLRDSTHWAQQLILFDGAAVR